MDSAKSSADYNDDSSKLLVAVGLFGEDIPRPGDVDALEDAVDDPTDFVGKLLRPHPGHDPGSIFGMGKGGS